MRLFLFSGFVLLWALFQGGVLFAQTPQADSLKALLRTERNPQRQVDLLNDIAFELFDINDSLAQFFAQQAAETARKADYNKGLKRALTYVGLGYVSRGNFPMAIRYYYASDSVKAEGAEEISIYNHAMLGNAFRNLARFDSAKHYLQMALTQARALGQPRSLAMVYKNLGLLHIYQHNYVEALESLRLAQENLNLDPHKYLQAEVWAATGKAYLGMMDFEQAGIYYQRMCKLVQSTPDHFQNVKCLLNLSELAFELSDYATALEEAIAALNLTQQYQYPPQQAEVYERIGEIYIEMGQFELAVRYLFQALRIAEQYEFRQRQGTVLSNLAWVYKEMGNLPLALEYINRSQQVREAISDANGIANCYNVRGLIFLLQKKYPQAVAELEKSRNLREQIGDLQGMAASTFNLALVYDEQGLYEKALALKEQVLSMEEQLPNKYNLSITLNSIARSFIKMRKFTEAWPYLQRAYEMATTIQARVLLKNIYATYADFYEATGDYRSATRYLRKHQQLSDSIYTTSSHARMAEMQALYQLEQKDQQIKLLEQQRQLREQQVALNQAQINNLRLVLAAGILVLVLISALTWSIYKSNKDLQKAHREIKEQHEEIQTQAEELTEANRSLSRLNRELSEKQEEIQAQAEEIMEANLTINEINRNLEAEVQKRTQELEQAYKELDTFFYRSSHDFRRPLTTFMGLAEVAKITVKDPIALELFDKVRETAVSLDKMLIKLQSISDVGAQEYVYREVQVKELFDSLCDLWREEIIRKNIVITSESHLARPFHSYTTLIKIILENLLENAIQFCAALNPRIMFSVHEGDDFIVLELSDNGHGIPAEFHDKVFDMYFRGSHHSKGNGLGLYIVKKAVEKLGGDIMFTSEVDKGTTFSVRLPRNTRISTIIT